MRSPRRRVLAVRPDGLGDVVLMEPALRQIASTGATVDLLTSRAGAPAGELLAAVSDVLVHDVPWSGYRPPPADPSSLGRLVADVARRGYDECVVLTSYHQSPLPAALVARWAGIPRVVGASDDYPGSLLDVRHRRLGDRDDDGHDGPHEVDAARLLAAAAGYPLLADDRPRLSVRVVGPADPPFVVVHPTASVPSRSLTAEHATAVVDRLRADGWDVVVTGAAGDATAEAVARRATRSLVGATTVPELAGVLAAASAVVVGNTGVAHLAAAAGSPVVCLFSPVVPARRWAPRARRLELLGDQGAPCRGTRARDCPVAGHPCLSSVTAPSVAAAVARVVDAGAVPRRSAVSTRPAASTRPADPAEARA